MSLGLKEGGCLFENDVLHGRVKDDLLGPREEDVDFGRAFSWSALDLGCDTILDRTLVEKLHGSSANNSNGNLLLKLVGTGRYSKERTSFESLRRVPINSHPSAEG